MILQAKAENAWEEAKAKSDFSLFLPHLKDIVAYQRNLLAIGALKMAQLTTHC